MLVRRRETLSLALVCLFIASAPIAEAADLRTKIDRAKRADRSGYAPALLARAAQVSEIEPNDTLDAAQSLVVGDVVDALVPDGDVDWFLVDATADAYVTISTAAIDGSLTDTVLDVFSADGSVLLASDDDGGAGLYSAVQSLAAEATVAVRVTRFSGLGDDAYRLTVETASAPPAPPANDAPATAELLEGCNAVLTGTTVGATSVVGAESCVAPDPLGGDVFYRVEVPYSYQLVVHVEPDATFDPAVYLFADAADPAGSCVAGIDEAYTGEQETLLFTNESPAMEPVVLYLAVDGWDPQRSGEFTASVSCDIVVDNDEQSFGAIKARF